MADDVDRLIARPFKAAYRRYRALSTRAQKVLLTSGVAAAFIALTAGPAIADDDTGALGWIGVTDSHGNSIWDFNLSLDRGGVTHAGRLAWSLLTEMLWRTYQLLIAVCCWLIDWTLSMSWVTWLAGPVMTLGDNLQRIVDKFGLGPTFLTITACSACLWMMRGRWVLGIFELFMSMIIASLAIGILSNPVRLIADEGGMLTQSRDAGLQIAVGLREDGDVEADPEVMRKEMVSQIADTFLRQPHQMVNYGVILDTKGGDCVDKYDEKLGETDKDAANDVKDTCDLDPDKTGVDPGDPTSAMFMNAFVMFPAGGIALIFSAVLCAAVLIAGAYALYQSLKMIVALLAALLPNGARGALWMTFAELAIAMVTVVFAIVFLAAYLLLLQAIFESAASKGGGMQAFFVMDLALLVGIVVFWKGRARLKAATERLAAAMAKRPGGGGPSALPAKTGFTTADAYYKSRMAMQGARAAGALGSGALAAGAVATRAASKAGQAAYGPIDRAAGQIKFASMATGGTQTSTRLKERLELASPPTSRKGQLLRLGAVAGTGGTAGVAMLARNSAAHSAVQVARRTALTHQLRPELSGPNPPERALPGSAAEDVPAVPSGPRLRALSGAAPPIPTPSSSGVPAGVGSQVGGSGGDPDAAARLRARLEARRVIPLPGPSRD